MAKKTTFREFQGLPKEGFDFLRELENDNTKAFFEKNRARYEESIKAPLHAFVEECEPEFGSGKMFRIHRDVRFSKDKAPYKTHASAVFESRGRVFYAHFEKDRAFAATGYHMMERDQLARFHAAIDEAKSGKKLVKLVEAAEQAGLTIGGSALKTAPRGYAKDHERIALLRHKGLTVAREWLGTKGKPVAWMSTPEAGERITDTWREGAAINAWLQEHVGESSEGRRFVKR